MISKNILGATLAALGLLSAGCTGEAQSAGGDVVLQLPAGVHPAGSGLPAPREAAPITIGAGATVCVSSPGAVTVERVRAEDPSDNFSIQGYALRPNPAQTEKMQLGEIKGTLSDAGFDPGQHRVRAVCGSAPGAGYELAIQLARAGGGPATSKAFLVDWRSTTGEGSLRIPLAVVLCDARTAFPSRCDTSPLME